ncbi:MAG: hypothetical protein ABL878_07745, partial [Burkholderiales bacterium]
MIEDKTQKARLGAMRTLGQSRCITYLVILRRFLTQDWRADMIRMDWTMAGSRLPDQGPVHKATARNSSNMASPNLHCKIVTTKRTCKTSRSFALTCIFHRNVFSRGSVPDEV